MSKRYVKPLLVCMTPVRNEAWVLHSFLKATCIWADYIIIADQGSTDGSIEIAKEYSKVTLIVNNNQAFNEDQRQKLLIDRAREIEGDKILFGLDADEVFTANFLQSNDWQRIINSVPGDVFWFKWAQVDPDMKHYYESTKTYYPWAFHDDGTEPHNNYVRNMHSMRIPYPIDERQMFYINEFKVLHLAYLNSNRVVSKNRFYKFVDWNLNKRSFVKLSRSYYSRIFKDTMHLLPDSFLYSVENHGFDLFENVNTSDKCFWFDTYIKSNLHLDLSDVRKLDIWDKSLLDAVELNDPRTLFDKLIHFYLRNTQSYSDAFLVKLIDKILIKVFRY